MKNLSLLPIIILLVFLSSCSHSGNKNLAKRHGYDTLIIISTNDVHAHLENMPKLGAYVQSQRDSFPNVIVLSAGDVFSGSPVVDQYQQRGFPMIDMMNHIGYMAHTMGNHEFDYGQVVLKDRIMQADFPFLCANADFSNSVLNGYIKPFVVTKSGGLKLAILGLLQLESNGLPSTLAEHVDTIKFITDRMSVVNNYRSLRDSGHVFIVLSHLGFLGDMVLSTALPEADVIIGGHSHTTLPRGLDTNNILITQTGSYLKNIGRTEIILKNGKVISRKNRLIPVETLAVEDSLLQKLLASYMNNPVLKRVVGRANADITGKDALGNFITDAFVTQNKWDIAFTNNGGIRVPSIPKGNITFEQIYEMDPFANQMMEYMMSADEIREFLKQAFNREKRIELQISGANYTVVRNSADTTKALDILLTDYNNKPLSAGKKYKVGMSTYIASVFMPLIAHEDEGRRIKTTTAETLIDYLKSHTWSPKEKRVFVK
jgi:2',3'-cyclic-nucleotide 2'-phosphodiesterase (5'-nucleotidase family)